MTRMMRWKGLGCHGVASAVGLALTLAAGGAALAAGKEDKVFTVGNYPIEAQAADAVAAKTKALAEGQQAAFRSLLRRIVPVTAYNRLPQLRETKAANLIDGFSVRSERNSATEYIASYDFAFQAEAVRQLLDQQGIPFLDRQAPQITLVPYYKVPTDGEVSEPFTDSRGSDAWLYAWKGLDLANTLTPLDLKPMKREVHADTIKALAAGDLGVLRVLTSEFGSETVVVAMLEPDIGQKRLKVTFVGRDAVAPFVLRRVYRLEGGDLTYTAELAAVIGLGVLEGRWKAINVRGGTTMAAAGPGVRGPRASAAEPQQGGDGPMRIAVEFKSMAEWQQISRALSQTPEITDLDVEGLSARGARILLTYPGGASALALTLAQQGLILRQAGGGWVLTQR
ncbi:MAG: DUF2066 domain-containing protein [Hyphomicrobiaceae bacterium]